MKDLVSEQFSSVFGRRPLERNILDEWDPAMVVQWLGHQSLNNTNVMSGQWAIGLALRVCPNGVDVYGVTHSKTPLPGTETKYHYFNEQRMDGRDSLPMSAQSVSRLAKEQGSCLRLHTPHSRGREREYPIPKVWHMTDKLVDAGKEMAEANINVRRALDLLVAQQKVRGHNTQQQQQMRN